MLSFSFATHAEQRTAAYSGSALPAPVRLVKSNTSGPSQLRCATDAELAQALLEDTPGAAKVVWQRFFPVVSGMARRRLGRSPDTEDVVQDVFVSVFRSARALKEPLALRAFVLTITIRTLTRELKRRRARYIVSATPDERLEDLAKVNADAASKHALMVLEGLLGRLRTRDRRVFMLTHGDGMDAPEVARVLQVSVPTVRRSLSRAWKRLSASAARDPFLFDYFERGTSRRVRLSHAT